LVRRGGNERGLDPRRTVIVSSLILAAILLVCAFVRTSFWTYGADTGTFTIAILNAPHGMADSFEQGSHFRYHWSPILVLLYPLVAITQSVLSLQIVQVFLVVGSVLAYYALIERYIGKTLALRCAIIALLYPPLIGLAFAEFHELAFAPLFTFLALLALSARRWGWYALLLLALLCVREDVALLTGFMGSVLTVYGARSGDRAYAKAGALTALSAGAVLLLYFGLIVPHLGGWGPSGFYTYSFDGDAHHLKDEMAVVPRLTYVLEILIPLAFLPLRTRWFLLTVPAIAIVLSANSGGVWRMGMHYVALWIPWVLLAMAAGLAQIQARAGERAAIGWSSAATALCVLFLVLMNPTHAQHYLTPAYRDTAAVQRVIHCVPPNATLGTHDEWYAAIAFTHPNETIGAPSYASYLLFADDYPNGEFQAKILPAIRRQVADGHVNEVCRSNRVAVYRRVQP
jgi:uncharacterized membrane protein